MILSQITKLRLQHILKLPTIGIGTELEIPAGEAPMRQTPSSFSEEPIAASPESMSLEAVEVEFALGAQDVLTDGFDLSLAKAADIVGGQVLFNMPALDTTTAQRIGAILVPSLQKELASQQDQVVFVTLLNDGLTLSHEPLSGNNVLFESLGRNYAAVMGQLKNSQ